MPTLSRHSRGAGRYSRGLRLLAASVISLAVISLPNVAGASESGDLPDGLSTAGLGTPNADAEGDCPSDHFSNEANDGQLLCTHGPDSAPYGLDVNIDAPTLYAANSSHTYGCYGDGTDGKRVQLLYARASDQTDSYEYWKTQATGFANSIDTIFNNSAAETGGERRVRFRTDASCNLSMEQVILTPSGDDSFWPMVNEIKAAGYDDPDTKYLVFVEANIYCGLGIIYGDDQPGQNNANNTNPGYSRIDRGCWAASVAAHELTHNLGGVQQSAPNSTSNSHCTDEWDLMCYNDGSGQAMVYLCTDSSSNNILDCNHDDYFNTNPATGSYLDLNWNVANSAWLEAAGSSSPPGAPGAVSVAGNSYPTRCTGSSCSVTATWSAGSGSTDSYLVTTDTGFTTTTSSTSATVTNLAPGASLTFTVTPSNGFGTGDPTSSSAYQVPAAPTAWATSSDGQVFPVGSTASLGDSLGSTTSNVVAGAATLSGNGYWLAESNGRVTAYGDAVHHGDMSGLPLNGGIAAMSMTSSGNGYWLMGLDGGIFSFGDAQFYGSMGGVPLNAAILDMTPSPNGYWLVGEDGGVFSFGDAAFYGSMGSIPLNAPVRSITAANDGSGYWLVGQDGGIFAFNVPFHGSLPGIDSSLQGVRIRAAEDGGRYWILSPDGEIFQFKNGVLEVIHELGEAPGQVLVDLFLG